MDGVRTCVLCGAIVTLVVCPAVWCRDANDPGARLQFEEEVTPLSWPGGSHPVGLVKPSFAAVMTWHLSGLKTAPNESVVEDYLVRQAQARRVDFSAGQASFWRAVVPALSVQITKGRSTPEGAQIDPNSYRIVLYAVSADDAKKASRAYVRFVEEESSRRSRDLAAEMQETSRQVTSIQNELSQLDESLSAMQKERESLEKTVPYRMAGEAYDVVVELDKSLNAAQIEAAAIQAKIDAIQSYQKDKQLSPPVSSRLEVMLVEESIALQAAQAKRQAAADLRKLADQYINLERNIERAQDQKAQSQETLPVLRSKLQEFAQRLQTASEGPPQLLDNKAIIHPIAVQ